MILKARYLYERRKKKLPHEIALKEIILRGYIIF